MRAAPGAPGWFAIVALLGALLDALGLPGPGALAPLRWLELVVLAGLPTAFLYRLRDGEARAWSTPLDGRLLASLLVLMLGAGPWRGAMALGLELRLVFTALAAYYTLSALVARDAAARAVAWHAFPLAATALGLHALWAATTGLGRVAGTAAAADASWGARDGLLSSVLVATLVTLGRALERGAPPAWRLAAVVGALGGGLHLAAAGSPVTARSLARLEDPLDFSAVVVVTLTLHWVGRTSWVLGRERAGEAGRWWGAMAATTLLGSWLLFGPGPPGEGLVLLAVTCAVLVAGAATAPAAAEPAEAAEAEEAPVRLSRAA